MWAKCDFCPYLAQENRSRRRATKFCYRYMAMNYLIFTPCQRLQAMIVLCHRPWRLHIPYLAHISSNFIYSSFENVKHPQSSVERIYSENQAAQVKCRQLSLPKSLHILSVTRNRKQIFLFPVSLCGTSSVHTNLVDVDMVFYDMIVFLVNITVSHMTYFDKIRNHAGFK